MKLLSYHVDQTSYMSGIAMTNSTHMLPHMCIILVYTKKEVNVVHCVFMIYGDIWKPTMIASSYDMVKRSS